MATLMRSSSCISSASSDNGVVSTATDVHCDNHYWSSMASLPLLAYYMVTSTILHSDDLNYLQSVTAVASVSVKFSPIYASLVKIIQFATCMLCLSTFASPNSSLVLIIVCNTIAVIAPITVGAEKSCSIAGITIFRSTGFVCVVWTAIVCIARQNSSDHYGWAIESSLWIGCGVIILVGLVLTYYLEHLRRKSWGKLTDQTELDAIITSLKNMHDEMFVEEATFGTDKTVRTDRSLVDLKWSARSPYELARSVINLERHIIADKLSHQFLLSRNEWKKKVINDVIPHYFNDWVPPSTEPNPLTIQDAGVLYLDNDNFAAMEEGAPRNNTNKGSMSTELIQCLTLVDQLNVLKENIRPRSAVNVFQSTVLQLLSYKLPVDVVRHIFSFFIDSSFIAIFLDEYIQCKMEVIQGLLVDTKAGGIAVHFPLLQHYLSTRKFTQRCYQSFALASRHELTSSPIEVAAKDKLFRACEGIDPRIPEPIKFPIDSIVQTNYRYLDNDRKKYVVVEVTYDETVLHNRYKIRIQSDPSGYLHSVSECDLVPARNNVAT